MEDYDRWINSVLPPAAFPKGTVISARIKKFDDQNEYIVLSDVRINHQSVAGDIAMKVGVVNGELLMHIFHLRDAYKSQHLTPAQVLEGKEVRLVNFEYATRNQYGHIGNEHIGWLFQPMNGYILDGEDWTVRGE